MKELGLREDDLKRRLQHERDKWIAADEADWLMSQGPFEKSANALRIVSVAALKQDDIKVCCVCVCICVRECVYYVCACVCV